MENWREPDSEMAGQGHWKSFLKSAGFGAVATAVVAGSGLLMVTMIGLINASLMTVQQLISTAGSGNWDDDHSSNCCL
jgi:hypothetical protein